MKKRFLSITLVLCMLLSIVPLTTVVVNASTTTYTLKNDTNGKLMYGNTAVDETGANGLTVTFDPDNQYAGDTTVHGYILNGGTYRLGDDVTIDKPLIIQGGTKDNPVTLDLCGHVLKYNGTEKNSVIVVANDAYFVLQDTVTTPKTRYAAKAGDSDMYSVIGDTVPNSGDYISVTGGIITGGTGTAVDDAYDVIFGGGMFVGSRATFTMTGGSIVGCTATQGGGVFVSAGKNDKSNEEKDIFTTFNMTGGSIVGCTATQGGGVFGREYAEFTMDGTNNARIANCTAKNGGGVYVGSDNKFTMNGGTIESCTANGTGNSNGNGGGVNVDGNRATFTMAGGTIKDCTAKRIGGGVYKGKGSFTMTGGAIVSCTANNGGGVGINNSESTFTMKDGTIKDCAANENGNGGGVYISSGIMEAQGGSVYGGVYIESVNGSTLENTSTTGSTIFYADKDGKAIVKGGNNSKINGKRVKFMGGTTLYAETVAGVVLSGTQYTSGGGKITLPTLTRDGYAFGWYKDSACTQKWDPTKTDGENDANFNVTGNHNSDYGTCTLYAGWTPNTYAVTLHTNGGTINSGTVTGYTYGIGATLPTDVTKEGFTFAGWYDDENLTGDPITEIGTTETEAKEYWAKWKQTASTYFTITFDPNGGTVDPTSATTDAYGKLTELPTPTRSGSYRFDGWFTEKNGGTAVTVDTVYEAHTTVYAHWTYTGSTAPDYCVIKATAGEGGSITPSGRAAVLYGASKTFTITPNDGYAIADVKVDGKSVGAVKTYTFERVRGDHTIEAVFMKATGNPQTGVDVPFTDVSENDWFYEDVAYVYANDLMKGTSETTFSPAVTTTRGMIVTILYRLEGEPTVSDTCPFDDVKSGSYYEKAITWAAANEIVSGYGNGKFGPDDAITREQMAVILYRYTQYKGMDVSVGEDTNILSYNDAQEISEYAFSAMQWACGESILNGSDGNLMPQGNATRAQVAAILHRFCENILK